MEKHLEILKSCPLFQGIGEDQLLRMLTCLGAKIEFYHKKQTILSEGDPARSVGVVLSGSAQITQVDYRGNRSILSRVRPSEIFAEAFACAEVDALPVSIIADEPCEIMLLDCRHILQTCQNGCGFHHQLIFNLMRDLAAKTIRFHERIEITSKRTTREKLLAYLSMEAKRAKRASFTIPFDRQELADYLEVERSGLSAEIGKLKRECVIRSEKNRFELI